jgi:hypothetical protein
MKRLSPEQAVTAAVTIAVLGLGLIGWMLRPSVSCRVIAQTNDAFGQLHVVFQLSNSYADTIAVGLYSIEGQTPDGWRSQRREGELLAGVPARGSKTFAFSAPQGVSCWRLRLVYSPPTSFLRDAYVQSMGRLFGQWPYPTRVIKTPVIYTKRVPNESAERTSAGQFAFVSSRNVDMIDAGTAVRMAAAVRFRRWADPT